MSVSNQERLSRKKMLPPGPKNKLPFGFDQAIGFAISPIKFLTNLAKYGDIVLYKVAWINAFLVNHPDYIKDILQTQNQKFIKGDPVKFTKLLVGEGLLTSEGEFHLRQRRLAQPAFHRQYLDTYAKTMVDYAIKLQKHWENGASLEVSQSMMQLTLSIVAKTLFDTNIESDTTELTQALNVTQQWADRVVLPPFLAFFLESLPIPKNRRYRLARAYLNETIYRLIRERRENAGEHKDLLSLLMSMQDEEGDHSGMTDKQLHDEAITFFLAGYETTSLALTWAWYLLSQNPEVEERLHEELDTVLDGNPPTINDLPKLTYTEMIFTEVLRLYPPVHTLVRTSITEYNPGNFTVPSGAILFLSPYLMHRDPRYFPEPEKFKPERWTVSFKETLPKFAYFPFGGGPRKCIGEQFAWMEGILLLATLAQKWKFQLEKDQLVELKPLITLRPKHGMKMIVSSR